MRCRAARVMIYVMTRKELLILLGGFVVTGGYIPKPKKAADVRVARCKPIETEETSAIRVRPEPVEVVWVSVWPGRWTLMNIDEWDGRGVMIRATSR